MKLYATTTSERASKGQGGNTKLDIQLTVGDRDNQYQAGVVALREIDKGIFTVIYFRNGEGVNLAIIDTKGKKQKTAKACDICEETSGRHSNDACEPSIQEYKRR